MSEVIFKTIRASSLAELDEDVSRAIRDGLVPCGTLVALQGAYIQTMVSRILASTWRSTQ